MGGLLSTLFDSTYVRYILLNNLYLPLKISLSRGLGSFTGLILPHFCACPKPGSVLPTSYVIFFYCVHWSEVRGGFSFCLYWWNCWPKLNLFKSCHNFYLYLSWNQMNFKNISMINWTFHVFFVWNTVESCYLEFPW